MDRARRKSAAGSNAVRMRAVPPPYGCFTIPRFRIVPAAEALMGLLFANLFWVGLWDLLDTTIFPFDSSYAMLLLVVLGTIGMYFTNALYDPEPDKQHPAAAGAAVTDGTYGATGSGTSTTAPAAQSVDASEDAPHADAYPRLPGPTLEELRAALDIQDAPFLPPRFEPWRLMERIIANCAAVFIWVGVWDQIDMNVLPLECSYNACGRCYKYGQFPCAWYKVLFIIVGLIGQFFTRGLYTDSEVTYARRHGCPCCGGRLKPVTPDQAAGAEASAS